MRFNVKLYYLYSKYLLVAIALWYCMSSVWNLTFAFLAVVTALLVILLLGTNKLLCDIGFSGRIIGYICLVMYDIFKSTLRLTRLIWSVDPSKQPAAIEWIRFDDYWHNTKTIALHANAITMTPGTFVIAVDRDGQRMLVHALFRSLISGLPDKGLSSILRDK